MREVGVRLQRLEAASRQLPAVPAEDDDRRPAWRQALSRGGSRLQRSAISDATSARVISIVSCQCSRRSGASTPASPSLRERERRRRGGAPPRPRRGARRARARGPAASAASVPQPLQSRRRRSPFPAHEAAQPLDRAPRRRRLDGRDVGLGLLRPVLQGHAVGLELGDAVGEAPDLVLEPPHARRAPSRARGGPSRRAPRPTRRREPGRSRRKYRRRCAAVRARRGRLAALMIGPVDPKARRLEDLRPP